MVGLSLAHVFLVIHILVEATTMTIEQEGVVAGRSLRSSKIDDAAECLLFIECKLRPFQGVVLANLVEVRRVGKLKEHDIARLGIFPSEFVRFGILVTNHDTYIFLMEVGFHDFPGSFRLLVRISSGSAIEDDGEACGVCFLFRWRDWLGNVVVINRTRCNSHDQHHGC